jgi:translocation protein SEC63
VFLIVKLRLSPPLIDSASGRTVEENDIDEFERRKQLSGAKDAEFLASRKDAEDLPEDAYSGWAHAPYWPGVRGNWYSQKVTDGFQNRKPAWWLILADDKTKRIVVPPMKITDIPLSRSNADRNYRSYKIQFQAPQNPGVFVWKVYVVSDTFVGEEITKDVKVKPWPYFAIST